jgi:RHS repeat-associated protein
MTPTPKRSRRAPFIPGFESLTTRRAIACLLMVLLYTQALVPLAAAPAPAAFHRALPERVSLADGGGATASPEQPQPATPDGWGVELKAVSTSFDDIIGIDHHQPSNKLVLSVNHPSGQPGNFELVEPDGAHLSYSNIAGFTGQLKIAAARDDGQGLSLGGFKPGELFTGTGVPGVIARIAANGSTVQNPWVTLPGETGQLNGGLYLDRTGGFNGDLIAVTTQGGVWRINSSGTPTLLASLNARLEGVTTVPGDADRYGPWAGKILVGAPDQGTIYAVNQQGNPTAYALGINPEEIRVIPAHENFYGVDAGSRKLWGAPAAAFSGMIGDVLVAQQSPGTLSRVRWNGTQFEVSEIAQAAEWKQITFSPAGVAEIPTVKQAYDKIAVVRHAPVINSGRVEGALWQLTGENVVLDGRDVITTDLLVPGTPTVSVSDNPTFSGTIQGVENPLPGGYSVALGGNATLRHLITRTNPIQLQPVAAPPLPTGTREVALTRAGESAGDFATLRHLSLSGQAGAVSVPPGTYGKFNAGGHTAFVFGVSNSAQPTVYNLEELTLGGGSELRLAGPVVITVKNNVVLSGSTVGAADDPRRVALNIAAGELRVSGTSVLYGVVRAPASAVTIEGGGRLRGTVSCDRLTVNGNGVLQITESDLPPPPINRPPAANAGPDQAITLPTDSVSLSGTATDDGLPVGSALSFAWRKVSGPAAVTFSDPAGAASTATFGAAGVYTLRLTVSDGHLTHADVVVITVNPGNQAPTVSAGTDQAITLPETANLSGTVADDGLPAGVTVAVSWSKISGPGDVSFGDDGEAVTTASFSAPGVYSLRLTASDSEFSTADEVTVTVNPANEAPSVNAGADQTVTLPGSAQLGGTITDDGLPAGSATTSAWSVISGPAAVTFADPAAASTTATFTAAGEYVLRLTATDSQRSASDDVVITVEPENQAPTAAAGPDQTITLPGAARLNGTVGDDGLPAGSSVSTAWTKVSGPGTVTFANASVTVTDASFSEAGTYVLRLTASDSLLTASDDITVVVNPANQAPTVSAGPDQSVTLPGTATLNGTASDDGLPAGSSVSTTWTKMSGPGEVSFSAASAPATVAAFSAPGTYVLRLSASDSQLSASDDVTVTVSPGNQAPAVNAGPDQTITLPAAASLGGVITDDGLPPGGSVSSSWAKVSGPGSVAFINPASATTNATFTQAGVYVLMLTASDSQLSASDTLTVTVETPLNPPTADFVALTGEPGPVQLAVESYSSMHNGDAPPTKLIDGNVGTAWRSGSSQVTNQFVTFRVLADQPRLLDRVRLQSYFANANLEVMVKDFEVQVSAAGTAAADFTTVFSGTYANTGKLEEFVFPGGAVRANYIKLVLKNNYGAPGYIEVATFEVSAAGNADSIISFPGRNNVALDQSPALAANGAAVVDYSYTYGLTIFENSPNYMLDRGLSAWSVPKTTGQYATVRLAGGKDYLLDGVKLATWYDTGSGRATAVKDFEVWVSDTTTDASAFTKVLTASAAFVDNLQNFPFPGGPVRAKYLKYVPVSNHGGAGTISTVCFDVMTRGTGGVIAVSGQFGSDHPAEAMLDGDAQTSWLSQSGMTTNQWVKIALADDKVRKIYGVRINPNNIPNYTPTGPKDFDVRVSTTTADDAAFTTVYSGSMTGAAGMREFIFAQPVDARYVQFYWRNSNGPSYLSVLDLEVLSYPDEGALLVAYSSQNSPEQGPLSALDIDTVNRSWITAPNQTTNQFMKLMLPGAELWTVDHVALRPGWLFSGPNPLMNMAAKDFEIQVSATDADDASFTTVYTGTLSSADLLQYFYFTPAQARYVRLLVKNNYGGTAIGLKSFYVYSPDVGGTSARFYDKSSDADGRIVSYSWDFGDGATSAERDPSHVYAQPGTYSVKLTVTDDAGLRAERQLQYRAVRSLFADFSLSPSYIHEGSDYVYLYNQSSYGLGPFAARYYDFGDGNPMVFFYKYDTAPRMDYTYHQYRDSGTYQIKYRIGDERGINYSASRSIQVLNLPPAVDIPAGKTVVWGESWTNAPTVMNDPSPVDQASLRCNWTLGDGRVVEVANCNTAKGTITHSYSVPGVYAATLVVTDKDGGTISDTATYTVNKRPTSLTFLETREDAGTYLMRARLVDVFANQPLAGKPVVFNVNGASAPATTNADGVAEARLAFAPGTPITLGTAAFFEDDMYLDGGSALTTAPGSDRPQTPTRASAGKDFWLTFPGNLNLRCPPPGCIQERPATTLFITSPTTTTGTVTVPGIGYTRTFSVQANSVTAVSVNNLASLDSSDLVETLGIHVTAQDPVTVYGLSDLVFTTDAFLGLPTDALGTEYVALGYRNGATGLRGTQFALVAANDATTVTITPSVAVGGRAARVPYTVTLNQGQTYQLRTEEPGESFDLSGTIITSDKPVAVFGGHKSGNVPHNVPFANHLVEQLPPTSTWGRYFVTTQFATRLKGDTFRFVAARDRTRVYVNGARVATLDRGQLHEQILTGPAYIISDQPILVAQYANGSEYDKVNGDPTMMIVPPYEQFGTNYTVATAAARFNVNYVNVVAPTRAVGSVTLDGAIIPPASFTPVGTSGFSGAQVQIGLGTHNLSGPEPFGVFVYGFAITDGYSYPGGMNLSPIVRSAKLRLDPAAATPAVWTEDCSTATVTDQNDNPLGGKQVSFAVTGVNPTTQSVTTDASGRARFCYTGANTGGDVIVAAFDNATSSASRTWRPNVPNQAPVVGAGADQTVTLPATVTLSGTATDDGLPTDDPLSLSWSKQDGPGSVTFGSPNSAQTTASFSAAGVYTLRLTAGDSELTGHDEVRVTVNPVPVNQPPAASAGADQRVSISANLIQNPGNEEPLNEGDIAGWTKVAGGAWAQAAASSDGSPEAFAGQTYFYAGDAAEAELRQDISLSAFAGTVATGTQQFEFKAYVRSRDEASPDEARVILEYRDAANQSVIGTLDSGPITTVSGWHLTEDVRTAPAGTGWIRVRLVATRQSGATNDAYFDALSLRAVGSAAVKLEGSAADDGLPAGGALSSQWSVVSGPGPVTFGGQTSASSAATFAQPGTYVLRLTASDSQLTTSDEVTITVDPANQPPVVGAGADQTVTLPAGASLAGNVTDDGAPTGGSLSARWSVVSGPGTVSFGDAHQAATTATFDTPGTYVLRLTAGDTDYEASDEVSVTVNPPRPNQPPTVNAGADRSITLPTDNLTLNGTATDDGLPNGSTLALAWNQTSGPGTVTFGTPNQATTTARFPEAGTYTLRLTADDSELTAFDEIVVTVTPPNQAPTANAGPDQTITLSQPANLNGTTTDDGLPVGSSVSSTWTKVSGPGSVTFGNANVTVTTATFSETGTYVLRLTATDSELAGADEMTVTVDPAQPAPSVELTGPADGAEITSPVEVVGSVSGGAWKLEYGLSADDSAAASQVWTTFAAGAGQVTNARLGTLDPTLMLNGIYTIRLSATDNYGQTSTTSIASVLTRELKIGNFTITLKDLGVPVAGVPMEIARTYDSRDKRRGDFGVGWSLAVNSIRLQKTETVGKSWYQTRSNEVIPKYCLQETRPHVVTVSFPDGKVYKFRAVPALQCQGFTNIVTTTMKFVPMDGTHASLVPLNGGDMLVMGSVPGPVDLVDQSDLQGYYYNPKLFRLTTEGGTVFLIDQVTGLRSVTDTNGNSITIDANGVTHSSGKSVAFRRDAQGRIEQITDPNGKPLSYHYDADGNLDAYTDAEGNVTSYTYHAGHYLKDITVTSSDGSHSFKPIVNSYQGGRLTDQTDAYGKVTHYDHDLTNRRETITDRRGYPTVHEYDEYGNIVYTKNAEGDETRYTHDPHGNVLTVTTAEGTTLNEYDDDDNLKQVTDPYGNVTKYTYNALRKVTSVTNAKNDVTVSTYDEATGNLLWSKDAYGNETRYNYFMNGQVQSVKLIPKDDPTHPVEVTYTYYDEGYLKTETHPLGHTTTYTYDENGNRKSETTRRTNAAGVLEDLKTSYEYDKLNRLVKTVYPDETFTQIFYNEIGQQSSVKNQLGRETKFEYDELGRLVKTIYPDNRKDETKYNEEGQRVQTIDRALRSTFYEYDKAGRLNETRYADGGRTTTRYDAAGRVAEKSRWLDATTKHSTTYRYEADGHYRIVYTTDALSRTTKQVYDETGNLWKVMDAKNHTTTYEYDKNGRRVKVIYHDGSSEVTGYDGFGRVVSRTDQAQKTTRLKYDELGRLVKVIDALTHETNYGYDEVGNQVWQTDANNHTTRFEYDKLGRRVKRTLPEGMPETFTYYATGAVETRTDFNGKKTTYDYDELGRLVGKTPDASFGQPGVSFTYTPTGQRDSMTDASGVTSYTYDLRNRLKTKSTPAGSLTYDYDKLGNLVSVRSSNQNGTSVNYGYDALERLEKVTDNRLNPAAATTTYSYDDTGNLQGLSYPNGVQVTYTYNDLNRLTDVTASKSATALAGYSYELGAAGNRLSVTELGGRKVTYTYDDTYRLTDEVVTGDPLGANGAVGYEYDDAGNRRSRTSTLPGVVAQAYTYDKNDRLASDTYDGNGNTKESRGTSYTYDWEDRLSSVNGEAVVYLYDGDGNRVAKTASGVTTRYLIDTNNHTGYAQVVEELQGSQVTRQYTYGHDLISQNQLVSGNWAVSFYGYDGHGSTRFLTDGAGAVTDTYTYDAFGNLIGRTGATPNDYLYSGERFDADTGLYYLRARYLNPESGRFWTMDSYGGSAHDPRSLHKYTYVSNEPVNTVDPSGNIGISDVIGQINIISWRVVLFAGQHATLFRALQLTLTALHLYKFATDEEYAYNFMAGMNPYEATQMLINDVRAFTGLARRGPGLSPVKFPNLYPDDIPGPVKVGRLVQEDGKWMVNLPGGVRRTASGRYIFVSIEGRIYVAPASGRAGNVVGHIDLSNGAPVDFAGEIRFSGRANRGALEGWSNASGHYKPHPDSAGQAGLPMDYFNPADFDTSPQRGIPLIDLGP